MFRKFADKLRDLRPRVYHCRDVIMIHWLDYGVTIDKKWFQIFDTWRFS